MFEDKSTLVVIVIIIVIIVVAVQAYRESADSEVNRVNQVDLVNQVKQDDKKNNAQLKIEDVVVGTGAEATSGALLTMNYNGTLESGKQFDSSYDRNRPFVFTLGAGEVIAGWDQGILGMKVGGKRKLTIPGELGYGVVGAPPTIPPNATLIFEVELLKVE